MKGTEYGGTWHGVVVLWKGEQEGVGRRDHGAELLHFGGVLDDVTLHHLEVSIVQGDLAVVRVDGVNVAQCARILKT